MTGREAMGLRQIREELSEYNAVCDGPCGVALMWSDVRMDVPRVASVVCADSFEVEPVIQIPGDGRPFSLNACVNALACSQVLERP